MCFPEPWPCGYSFGSAASATVFKHKDASGHDHKYIVLCNSWLEDKVKAWKLHNWNLHLLEWTTSESSFRSLPLLNSHHNNQYASFFTSLTCCSLIKTTVKGELLLIWGHYDDQQTASLNKSNICVCKFKTNVWRYRSVLQVQNRFKTLTDEQIKADQTLGQALMATKCYQLHGHPSKDMCWW